MLNITLAEVTPGNTNAVAEVYIAQAAVRPLAGFGAGAFACDGAWVGSSANQPTAGPALPRVRGAFADVRPVNAPDGFGGAFGSRIVGHASTIAASTVGAGTASTRSGNGNQLNPTTRIYPVTPGGLGPHPAREPEPV
jgi:hypothetical protein